MPSLKKFSKVADKNSAADAASVSLQRTYTEIDDCEQKEIPTDQ